MKNKLVFFLVFLMLTFAVSFTRAQAIRPVLGQKFEYKFRNLINYPDDRATVSDFEGKLLILYFWNTGCTSCLRSWPDLLRLQEMFRTKVQFVLVNALQSEQTVREAIRKQKETRNVEMVLPIVVGDTILEHLFSYPGVPKVAWFDGKGHFRSFTGASYVNESVIRRILNAQSVPMFQLPTELGENIYMNDKRSKLWDFRKPFFVDGNGEDGKYMPLVTQSVLTGKVDGLMPVLSVLSTDTLLNRLTVTLQGTIDMMYRIAYNDVNFFDGHTELHADLRPLLDNRVEWNVKNPNFSFKTKEGVVNHDFFYAYQLTTQITTKARVQRLLQDDLRKYFGLNVSLEKRRMKCLVLTALDTTLMRVSASRDYFQKGYYAPHDIKDFVSLISYSDRYFSRSPYPVIDETGYLGKIGGFRITHDYDDLQRELYKCGIGFIIEEREVDVLVVTEPDNYEFPSELIYQDLPEKIIWRPDGS